MAETKNGIKYPDNYNSVADIPKDLKEMAESIDPLIENKVEKENGKGLSTNDFTNAYKEKLDGLKNYDDTEIKKDISDIQEEQKTQNEDIEALKAENIQLKTEVSNLREDAKLNGLTEDNEGELVHIDNSTGARFNSLEICGNDKQETTDISPSFDEPSPIKCVGDNKNVFDDSYYKGFIVTQQDYNALEGIDLKLENNKYYVAKIYFDDGTSVAVNNSNFMLYAYKADGTQSANIPNQIAKSYANATELVKAKIVANSTGLSTYANKVIKGIKIEEVADADGQPSPYSNYGQGCIKLKVVNKNFLDIQKNATVTKGGITVTTDENGVLTLNGTTTTNIYIKLNGKDIMDNNISNWKKSCFRKGIYKFTSEVLTTTQAGNINAFLRKDAYKTEGQYATLYQLMNAKTKTATANILEDTEAVVYLWIASGITLNNAKLKFQIELDNATDIVTNEEQNDIIPVQQKMLTGDGFSKKDGTRKEVHTWQEVIFNGEENWLRNYGTSLFNLASNNIYNQSNTEHKALCNMAKFENRQAIMADLADKHFAMQVAYNSIFFKDSDFKTVEEFKAKLKELYEAGTPLKVAYKINAPVELDCTKEQIEVLNKVEQEAHTYSEVTNIYTEDEVGAIIKSNTAVDLKSVINNVVEAQLQQIGG